MTTQKSGPDFGIRPATNNTLQIHGTPPLSPDQAAALDAIQRWYFAPGGGQVFRLFGNAGVGKTTVIRLVPALLGLAPWMYRFAALAGKAAEVLRSKGCEPASTLHSLIYTPVGEIARQKLAEIRDELARCTDVARLDALRAEEYAWVRKLHKPGFVRNPDSDVRKLRLLFLDEASMIDEETAADLLSFGVRVIVLGDPFQLPPVEGDSYFMRGARADAMLTTIHRQAGASRVLDLATRIRQGGELYRADRSYLTVDGLLSHDQVLCGINRTRWTLINQMRQALGRPSGVPVPGDKLIANHGNRELATFKGQAFDVLDCAAADEDDRLWRLILLADDGRLLDGVYVPRESFTGEQGEQYAFSRRFTVAPLMHCTFANAITVHRAQGSEWGSVALIDESWAWKRPSSPPDEWSRWLYTGITRARTTISIAGGWR